MSASFHGGSLNHWWDMPETHLPNPKSPVLGSHLRTLCLGAWPITLQHSLPPNTSHLPHILGEEDGARGVGGLLYPTLLC